MLSERVNRVSASAALAVVCAFASHVAAQDKNTLWTKVSAEGRTLTLTWDKSHPWDAVLSAQGAELIARYFVDARREVAESLGRAARGRDSRMVRFELPESVRANPTGPICLSLQLPDRRTLPIRRADDRNSDTVGFRYVPWERQIRQAAEARAARDRVTTTERALATATRSITAKEASFAQRGWTDIASCDQVAAPSATLGPRPADVVAPEEQDDVARRVCVNRVANGYLVNQDFIGSGLPKLLGNLSASQDAERARGLINEVYGSAFAGPPGVNPAVLVRAVSDKLGADNATLKARSTQTAEFLRDWAKWVPTLDKYIPQLGSPNDDLGWPSTAAESALRLFGPDLAVKLNVDWAMKGEPPGTVRDLEAFLGASLDAYSGCVDDSRKQLKTKSDNWEALRSVAPQRAASARDFLIRECRQEIGVLEKMRADGAALQQQLARERQTLTTVSAAVPLAAKATELNQVACNQQP